MSNTPELKSIIEALLLAADEPLSINRLADILAEGEESCNRGTIREALTELQADYSERSMDCVELGSGFTFRVQKKFSPWVARLWDVRPVRYTRAFLETLALIAYRQPITRAEIEQVRGVAVSSQIIKSLLEREWVKVVGHRDLPGKPAVLATTKQFLDYFNLKSLDELPSLADLKDLDQAGTQLELQLQEAMGGAFNPEAQYEEIGVQAEMLQPDLEDVEIDDVEMTESEIHMEDQQS